MTGWLEMQLHGVQALVLKVIQDSASPVMAIMPTGRGKSMLFMLPAYTVPGGCTIMVVLLLSLRADLMICCQALGILCMSWESCQPPNNVVIVLVTPKLTKNLDFYMFLNCQQLLRQLDRIMINKCHVILNQQKDFDLQWPDSAVWSTRRCR
jgi:superfamily II DNA helicase RecQ